MPPAFVFDPNRCTGCQACELACSIENDLGLDRSWREVVTFNDVAIPGIPRFHLSLACNHCSEPACMHSCPALAYSRDLATGAVLIDPDRCIGCRYCSWACPYGAPRFDEESGVMGKCTFCAHRLGRGSKPACATLCPTGALDFADLPASEMTARVEGFPQTGLGPSLRIEPPRRSLYLTEAGDAGFETEAPTPQTDPPSPGVTLRTEWSLASFTFLTTILFAAYAGAAAGALRLPAFAFAGLAGIAAAFSLAHLGRPERAWRACLNLRRSWLSREVVGFGAFAAAGTIGLAGGGASSSGIGTLAALLGLLTLVSADQVYRPVYRGGTPLLDGGGATLTGLFLAGLVLRSPWLAAVPWLLKVVSAARDASRDPASTGAAGPGIRLLSLRVALGLALPAGAWISTGDLPIWALAGTVAGEGIGRACFYQKLSVESPARRARADLLARLRSRAA
ncbi:MAG: DmsC/YnfH family molybdoenzyme membrane anchor subunit [Candidatus Palauibacterales bacterium]|nr:DmsC/YnfH family molybdoenzyme membrane anchor subunit [Candidatus Palauibacterales bacterium]